MKFAIESLQKLIAVEAGEYWANHERLVPRYESIDAMASIQRIHLAQRNLESAGPQLKNRYSILEQVEHPDQLRIGNLAGTQLDKEYLGRRAITVR